MAGMSWWDQEIYCPQCRVTGIPWKISSRADGALRFVFYCPECKETLTCVQFFSELQRKALMNDLESVAAIPTSHQLPLASSASSEEKKKDAEFLRGLKISDPEENPMEGG